MNDYEQLLHDLKNYREDYKTLLVDVTEAAERAKADLGAAIVSIYTRPDLGDGPFKDSRKIASKLRGWGLAGPGAILNLHDIVGLTIVVQYPDQRTLTAARLKSMLPGDIEMGEVTKHENKQGYFAHHVICSRLCGTDTLLCEVQIKTMLHDAWGKKMHDLTYKPAGKLDPRLHALMVVGSTTVESVERQSETIREMILSNWDVERDARHSAREQIFSKMLRYGSTLWDGVEEWAEVQDLHREIESKLAWLIGADVKDPALTALLKRIDKCRSAQTLRFGWLLAGRIASVRHDRKLVRSCTTLTDLWLKKLPKALAKGEIQPREVSAIPLMFYVMNEFDLSIEYADQILADPEIVLEPKNRATLAFNRAQTIVEREYHAPTAEGEGRAALRAEVERALGDPALLENDDIESSIRDLEGLVAITFATNKEDVRRGIVLCAEAERLAAPSEKEVTEAYAELNTKLGWRRYFELEIEERSRRGAVGA